MGDAVEEKCQKQPSKLVDCLREKAGMTRIFDETGNHVPVTVIKLVPNVISQVKTTEKDGYNAYQVAYNKREKN